MTLPGGPQVTTGVWLAAVGALRNFALVKSARLHMLKEGWLNHCATLLSSIGTAERAKEQPSAEALCQFLANFAFAADGQVRTVPRPSDREKSQRANRSLRQSGCLKVSGMLPAVVGTLRCPRVETQRAAALALRNTCFLRTPAPLGAPSRGGNRTQRATAVRACPQGPTRPTSSPTQRCCLRSAARC